MSRSPKRLIMSVGDARVGKSTVIRLTLDLFHAQGKRVQVYDHDTRFKLAAYSQMFSVESIDFFRNGTDIILEQFKGDFDALAVDMPGQYLDKICQYIDNVNLLKLLHEYGWRLTFLQPISHRLDCVAYLEQLLDCIGDAADYVVIKNQYFDNQFSQFQRAPVYDKLVAFNATDIVLQELNKYSYETVERRVLPYSQVSKTIEIYSIYRAYTYRWIKSFHHSIIQNPTAKRYLGLIDEKSISSNNYP